MTVQNVLLVSSGVVGKNVGGAGSCNSTTDTCKFPMEDLMGAQNFNFAPKFVSKWGSLAPNFAFLDESVQTTKILRPTKLLVSVTAY